MKATFVILLWALLTFSPHLFADDAKVIKVGYSGPASGPTAWAGQAMLHGMDAYFKRANKTGINGHTIEIVSLDDGYEPGRTLENARTLLSKNKVFAFIGVYGGPTVNAILPLIEQEDVPLVGPITGANLTKPVRKNLFMVRPSSADEAEAIVSHVVDAMGMKEIGILYQDDAYGASGLEGIKAALIKRGLQPKVASAYTRNSVEVEKALDTIASQNPKAVILWGVYPATAAFVKKAVAKKFAPVFFGAASVAVPVFFKDLAEVKFDFYASAVCPLTTDTSLELVKNYLEDMKAAGYTDIHQYTLESYVNARIFAEGLRRAGANPTRPALRKALEEMNDVNLGGLKITYAADDHTALDTPIVAHLENGQLIRVATKKK